MAGGIPSTGESTHAYLMWRDPVPTVCVMLDSDWAYDRKLVGIGICAGCKHKINTDTHINKGRKHRHKQTQTHNSVVQYKWYTSALNLYTACVTIYETIN